MTVPHTSRLRTWAPYSVAGAFAVSGVIHLVKPSVFTGAVPRTLPAKRELVYASGLAELACAAGLARRHRWAAGASVALLAAIWPANLQMAIDASRHGSRTAKVLTWARMPLQVPLMWAAWQARPAAT
ncbi:MAG: DoxX family protein [Actinomycetota bacterium]|nr:DoxX family protein [Actinomycetota bacterium]